MESLIQSLTNFQQGKKTSAAKAYATAIIDEAAGKGPKDKQGFAAAAIELNRDESDVVGDIEAAKQVLALATVADKATEREAKATEAFQKRAKHAAYVVAEHARLERENRQLEEAWAGLDAQWRISLAALVEISNLRDQHPHIFGVVPSERTETAIAIRPSNILYRTGPDGPYQEITY